MMQVSNDTQQKVIINLHDEGSEVVGSTTLLVASNASVELGTSHNMVVGTHPGEQVPPADVKATPGERAHGLIRGLQLVLQHHSIPKGAMESFKTQATAYLTVESEAVFFKRAKYLTVAPMARYLRCEAPKSPDQAWKPVGQYKNWANTRLRVFNRQNTHLWYSILQGKRSALPLSDELVLTAYKEHRQAMEIPDPIDEQTHASVMKELTPVLKVVRKLLRRVLWTASRESDWLTPTESRHVASTKASYEESRAGGGQLGAIMRHVPQLYDCNPLNPVGSRRNPDLVRMVFYPRAIVSGRVQLNTLVEEYAYPEGERMWHDSVRRQCVRYAEKQRTLKATIQVVLEPLKARVISKGNAAPYYASKRLQKALHDVMREMDCFRLIGAPLKATDLFDLAEHPVQTGTGQLEWFSIDYSAATDRLSARLSSSILNYLVEGQDPGLVNMWRAVLAPHDCEYPFPYDAEVPPVKQRNGQLMGSILSFPVLCLANLGLYLETIKGDTRGLRAKLSGVLVNGDDMLYVAPNSLWKTHVENGAKVGLTMSPGKAYHHPVYANANSACYHFDLSRFGRQSRTIGYESVQFQTWPPMCMRNGSTPFSIPFLNTGLYFGQNKVLGGDDVKTKHSYISVIDRLVDGARPGKAADLLAMYLHRHKVPIQEEAYGRNLFLPISLGGMGVQQPDGFESKITLVQRVIARRLFVDCPFGVISQLPLEEKHLRGSIPEARQLLQAPWLAGISLVTPELRPGDEVPDRLKCMFNNFRGLHKRGAWEVNKILGNKLIHTPLRVSCARRPDCPYRHRQPLPDPFSRQTRKDWFAEDISALESEVQSCTSWGTVCSALGRSIDWDLYTDFGFWTLECPGVLSC